jgi:plasmid maintenance system killer protein
LLGLSREELLIKLGNPDKKHDSKQTNASTLFYWVERNWELIIYLENESVIDVKFKKIKS